jgi:glycosidase
MSTHWAHDAVFYHVYPLGACDAPATNDGQSPSVARIRQLIDWLPHWQDLGINALYLGPVCESTSHGYDTADYFRIDRRLGDSDDLRALATALHRAGIRLVLDGVFNHVGRDFWAFRDVCRHGEASPYRDWFAGLRFDRSSPYGDPFTYDTWQGHYNLVKLNLAHPAVREHLFAAIASWITAYDIDGLRLDAADCLSQAFMHELGTFCRAQKPDFWLMGEVIHGDYRPYTQPGSLDATTNYECYKGLYSSHNDRNYFEIAHSLQRQFGPGGIYRGLPLYSFADNHDVDRIASQLRHAPHLYPLHILLFGMPGVPSLYYGSEWGLPGRKADGGDAAMRPALASPATVTKPHPDLAGSIRRLIRIRQDLPALRHGDYRQLLVRSEQVAFARQHGEQLVVVAVNGADNACDMTLSLPDYSGRSFQDVLQPGKRYDMTGSQLELDDVPPCWGRILVSGLA